jgi:hypothetical protein
MVRTHASQVKSIGTGAGDGERAGQDLHYLMMQELQSPVLKGLLGTTGGERAGGGGNHA